MIIELDSGSLESIEQAVNNAYEAMRIPAQDAAAEEIAVMVMGSFGVTGTTRQFDWQGLAPKYARRVGRQYPTLYLNEQEAQKLGAESGRLKNSTVINTGEKESAYVVNRCEYAAAHQSGTDHIPARPFFPMDQNGVMPAAALERVIAAAQSAVDKL
jgi:phage gpG-like protein